MRFLFPIIFIVGGLSGTLVLRGTGSSLALVAIGVVLLIVRLAQANENNGEGEVVTADDLEQERENDQWAEYQRSRAAMIARQQTAQDAQAQLDALLDETPGARAQVADLLERTKPHLNEGEQLNLALETARRLHAEKTASAP
jgi:hypothetical protein